MKSEKVDKTYVRMTNDIERRLKEHNSGKSIYTKKYISWKLVYEEELTNRNEAREKEKYFKSASGRRRIKSILN